MEYKRVIDFNKLESNPDENFYKSKENPNDAISLSVLEEDIVESDEEIVKYVASEMKQTLDY